MKKRSIIFVVVFALLVACFATACTKTPSEPQDTTPQQSAQPEASTAKPESDVADNTPDTEEDEYKFKLGFLVAGYEYPSCMGALRALEEYCEENKIELLAFDGKSSGPTQADQALNLISMGVDAAICNVVDSELFVTSAEAFHEAGIPFVVWCTPAPACEQYYETFVGPNDPECADMWVDVMKEAYPDASAEDPIKVAEVCARLSATFAQVRHEDLLSLIEADDSIELLEWQACENGTAEEAMVIAENYLAKFDDIDVIIAHDDGMATGVIKAIENAGREGIKVFASGGEPSCYSYIKSGAQYMTLVQHFDKQVILATQALETVLSGGTVDKITYDNWVVATQDNIDSIDLAYKE